MKIRLTIEPSADTAIRFYEACHGAAKTLFELGFKALQDGDHEQFGDAIYDVIEDNDEGAVVGEIRVSRR